MTDAALNELQAMRMEFSRLLAHLSPWISIDEMCTRYDCTPQTLTSMERRGDIPMRVKGKRRRTELMQWESLNN